MSKLYFTLTGTKHYFGKELFEGLGKIGYVANSSYTVIGDSMSAGRIYEILQKQKQCWALITELFVAQVRSAFWKTKRNLKNQKRKSMNKETLLLEDAGLNP